jgi:hypothetical protein
VTKTPEKESAMRSKLTYANVISTLCVFGEATVAR